MYPILYYNAPVGDAEMKREGLYYRFICTCTPPDTEMYRIFVSDGKTEIDLGICVPEGGRFVLRCALPAKRLSGQTLVFTLKENKGMRHPVTDGEPFSALDKLDDAYFEVIDGQAQITEELAPSQQDSDRSQESLHISE